LERTQDFAARNSTASNSKSRDNGLTKRPEGEFADSDYVSIHSESAKRSAENTQSDKTSQNTQKTTENATENDFHEILENRLIIAQQNNGKREKSDMDKTAKTVESSKQDITLTLDGLRDVIGVATGQKQQGKVVLGQEGRLSTLNDKCIDGDASGQSQAVDKATNTAAEVNPGQNDKANIAQASLPLLAKVDSAETSKTTQSQTVNAAQDATQDKTEALQQALLTSADHKTAPQQNVQPTKQNNTASLLPQSKPAGIAFDGSENSNDKLIESGRNAELSNTLNNSNALIAANVKNNGNNEAGQVQTDKAGKLSDNWEIARPNNIQVQLTNDGQGSPQHLAGQRSGYDAIFAQSAEKFGIESAELFSKKQGGTDSKKLQSNRGQDVGLELTNGVAANRLMAQTSGTPVAKSATVSDPAAAVKEQIRESIQSSLQQGNRQITIQLHPPELGRVYVKFSQQGNELTGLLETTNPQTRGEIQQAIPEVMRALEQLGIAIRRIDVTLSDSFRQSAQQSWRDSYSHDASEQFAHHSFNDSGSNRPWDDSFAATEYLADATAFNSQTTSGAHQSSPSNELLDVLI